MHKMRRAAIAVLLGALIAAGITVVVLTRRDATPPPGCVVSSPATPPATYETASSSGKPVNFSLNPEQSDNAATIAAVGRRLGMSPHAVTIALATAMQESQLRNLSEGDRDSLGLFQQRPSQGWGTPAQILDPVYAATTFYKKLQSVAGWDQLSVNDAAQTVQRSGVPMGYAQWESKAEAFAIALTGQTAAAMSCYGVVADKPTQDLVQLANKELGTAALSGAHPTEQGWLMSYWLIAHASKVGIDRVSFNGSTWTAESGVWTQSGPADGQLSLHRFSPAQNG
jgi:hypothetical protein